MCCRILTSVRPAGIADCVIHTHIDRVDSHVISRHFSRFFFVDVVRVGPFSPVHTLHAPHISSITKDLIIYHFVYWISNIYGCTLHSRNEQAQRCSTGTMRFSGAAPLKVRRRNGTGLTFSGQQMYPRFPIPMDSANSKRRSKRL